MRRSITLIMLLSLALGGAKPKPAAHGLPAKLRGIVDKIEAAYVRGDLVETWRLVAPTISGLKPDVAELFENALAAKEIPAPGDLLVQARLKLLMENRIRALPEPSVKERLLVLEALEKHVRAPLEQIAAQPLLSEDAPVPEKMADFDQKLAEIRELYRKLMIAAASAKYGAELAAKLPALARKKLTDSEKQAIAIAEGDLGTHVEESAKALAELELETYLQRLKYGVEQLRESRLTTEKFIAAASTRRDGRVLTRALSPPPDPPVKGSASKRGNKPAAPPTAPPVFHRAALSNPNLADDVEKLLAEAADLAGPLADRSEGFALGLEAWLRGRYGFGPDAWGLAKSAEALKRPELLQVVSMPEKLPGGADKEGRNDATVAEHPDRRHHCTWAWEDRRLSIQSTAGPPQWWERFGKEAIFRPGSTLDDPGLYATGVYLHTQPVEGIGRQEFVTRVTLPPQDERLVNRIVGFLEYGQAIQHLDRFVADASLAEFEVGEEIIRANEAFRFEVNLSRKLEQGNALSERSGNPRDDYYRHGLEWILALARVETGAMLAGFTSHENPFLVLAPTAHRNDRVKTVPFGRDAYAEMLLDGSRTHYWSIVREHVIENYFKSGIPGEHLLPYGRRALVGRKFVDAVRRFHAMQNDNPLQPAQLAELKTYDETFLKLARMMLYCLTFKLGVEKTTEYEHVLGPASQKWIITEHDQTPDAIRQILQTVDPTLIGCPCR
jgi:hypothetical protein